MVLLLRDHNRLHLLLLVRLLLLQRVLLLLNNLLPHYLAVLYVGLLLYYADVVSQILQLFVSPLHFLILLHDFASSIQKCVRIIVKKIRSQVVRPPMKSQRPKQGGIVDVVAVEVFVGFD